MTTPDLNLAAHTGHRYEKGRSLPWQIAWHVVSNAVFQKWWFPARLRPAVLRAFGAEVGDGVLIRQEVRIHWPWRLRIEGPAWIGHGAWLLNLDEITVAAHACISQEALLCTGSHDRHDPGFEHTNAPIAVGRGAWVCARATLLAGTVVEPHAIVGSGVVAHHMVRAGAILFQPQTTAPGRSR
ncbi:LbetaH domain-containing protein [Pseudonocardia phyllosphaerae]|uniref:hypothetical protein n=1 Tax=Pseudonocardia phyllosphaerae TaxID=3390502 RepID=UPI003978E29A